MLVERINIAVVIAVYLDPKFQSLPSRLGLGFSERPVIGWNL
jgi:hypothetical protein